MFRSRVLSAEHAEALNHQPLYESLSFWRKLNITHVHGLIHLHCGWAPQCKQYNKPCDSGDGPVFSSSEVRSRGSIMDGWNYRRCKKAAPEMPPTQSILGFLGCVFLANQIHPFTCEIPEDEVMDSAFHTLVRNNHANGLKLKLSKVGNQQVNQ